MQKFFILLITVFIFSSFARAQKSTLSKKDKASLDSMMASDEFLKLMKGEAKNTFEINMGMGNGAFSSHNQAANATGYNDQLIIAPGIIYHLKSGFSFGITGYLTNDTNKKLTYYQTGLNALYEYFGDQVTASISYTRYLSDVNKYNGKSLFQNDIYGYFKKSSGIIQPGLAIGFANGKYKEANMVKFVLKRPLNPRGDTLITGRDSTDNKATYFSVSPYIEHDFSFYKLFTTNDELDFTPTFMVNFGSDKSTQTHTNQLYNRPGLKSRKRVEANNKFQLQSLGASFDVLYTVGKWYIEPTLYLDYYLPQTTEKRFSAIYSVIAGFTF